MFKNYYDILQTQIDECSYLKLNKYVNIASEYCDTNKLRYRKDGQIFIYGPFALHHANSIANAIAETTIHVQLNTVIPNRVFTIMAMGSRVVTMYAVNPNKVNTVMLIDSYYTQFDPARYSNMWVEKAPNGKRHKHNPYKIHSRMLKWLKNRKDIILVGTHAAESLLGNQPIGSKIQIISSNPNIYKKICSEISGRLVPVKIDICVIPRLKKKLIKVGKMTVVEIFDTAEYTLIPYVVKGGINIGTSAVVKMYMAIDMYYGEDYKWYLYNIPDVVSTDYIGVYSDVEIYLKKESLGNKFYPYYPEIQRLKTGSYRKI